MRITVGDLLKAAKGDTSLAISIIEAPDRPLPGQFNPTAGYWRAVTGDGPSYALVISLRPEDEGATMTDWEREHASV